MQPHGRLALCTLFPLLFAAVSAADHILLQVEDFEGPWRRQTNICGYLGNGFCTSNANPKVAESAMVGQARIEVGGRHAVWVRAYTSENSPRALQAEVAGQRLAVTHKGRVKEWRWERAGDLDLPPGEVSIVVHDADVGFESADAVLITDQMEYDPMSEETRWSVYGDALPERASALRYNIDACCRLLQRRTDPADLDEWEARRGPLQRRLAAALGLDPLPPRTPLNPRVTGRAERDLYTIENVVFESRPRFYVTANLYLPKNTPLPAPGVVVVPGHAMKEGKNNPGYQMAMIGLARLGFVVLAYDPIGQGERQLPEMGHHLGYSLLLVGQTNEGVITWDTMRAIDYLCTRPEVDPERLGLTGNSGGGENTFYASAIDDRVKAAASCCFVCSYDAWIREGGNHCICNHLPGIVREMEEFEIVGLVAPRPFLIGSGTQDRIFPIEGTRETFRRAQRVYEFEGTPDRVALAEADLGHGWSQPLREACYGWMACRLQGQGTGEPIPEASYEAEPFDSPDLLCLDGSAMPEDAETLVTLARSEARDLRARYAAAPGRGLAREDLWQALGGRPRSTPPRARDMGGFEWEGRAVRKLALTTEPGLAVPALLILPEAATRPSAAAIYLDPGGKVLVRGSPLARSLLARGIAVLALDPRGLGEGAAGIGTADYNHVVSDSFLLGRPLLAQQAWDVIQAARYLASPDGIGAERIGCYGYGPTGLIALLAAALDDGIAAVASDGALASYLYAIEDSQPQPKWVFAPSILKVADIPQIAALCAHRSLFLGNPVGFGEAPLSAEEAAGEFAFTRKAFGDLERGDHLRVVAGPGAEVAADAAEWLAAALLGPGT